MSANLQLDQMTPRQIVEELDKYIVGQTKAKTILNRAVPESAEKPFAFFAEMEKEVVMALLGAESPQVLSVVVPFLEKAQAAAFLKTLAPGARLDLASAAVRAAVAAAASLAPNGLLCPQGTHRPSLPFAALRPLKES